MAHNDNTIIGWPHDDILHAWWVQPGRLLAGEYPAALDADKSIGKRRILLQAGVDSIVDLTEAGERSWGGDPLEDYRDSLWAAADELGVARPVYVRYPIPDQGVLDDDGYHRIVEHIAAELAAGRVVYLHCWGGKGRTATVAGAWLIAEQGLDYPAVLDRIGELRAGTRKAGDPAPENATQRGVLQRLAARQEV